MSFTEEEVKSIANHWLFLWGDCLVARRCGINGLLTTGAPYATGAPGSGSFRPADDPPPMAFVFIQVERALSAEGSFERAVAEHFWSYRRRSSNVEHPDAGTKSRSTIYRVREEILRRVALAIRTHVPESIGEQAVQEARLRLRHERSKAQSKAA